MTIDTNAILKLTIDLMGEREIKVTASQSLKGAVITGACAFVGGIVAGPPGLAIGGASGGILAAFTTKATFKPISQILYELSDERKEQIADEIQSIIDKLEINDLTELVRIALICQTIAQPQKLLIDTFIREAIPVIERHSLLEFNTNNANN